MPLFQVVGRFTAYATLAVVLLAPLAAAFRGGGVRQGGNAMMPSLQGTVKMADEQMAASDTTQVSTCATVAV